MDGGSLSAQSWEQKTGVAVSAPVLAQQMKRGQWQRDIGRTGVWHPAQARRDFSEFERLTQGSSN